MAASAVLMIGSTGSGKSALGNFLFDPRCANKECFEVATDNRPKTQTCKAVRGPVKYRQGQGSSDTFEDSLGAQSSSGTATGFVKDAINKFSKLTIGAKNEMSGSLTVIDTPGVNEGRKEDLKHMTGLVTTLKEQEVFKACIFVVKFSAKIDQQYKDTIMYYAKLLPDLFSHNCLIVMTEYATDKRSEGLRKRKNEDYSIIVNNVKEEIIKCSGICFTPIIFTIDSIPFGDDEVERSKQVRDAILSYIFSLREVRMTKFLVAKTRILQSEDNEEISRHHGKIEGYNERLKDANTNAKEALDELKKQRKSIDCLKAEIKSQEKNLTYMDTDDLVTAHVWSIDDAWQFFKKKEKKFDETSQYEVHNIERWTNGHCQWKEFVQNGNRVHGVVQGEFMRGLYASFTMETEKRIKCAKDIEHLKTKIESLELKLQSANTAEEACKEKHSKFKSEMSALEKYMEEKRELIEYLSQDTMTLEQAKAKLEKRK